MSYYSSRYTAVTAAVHGSPIESAQNIANRQEAQQRRANSASAVHFVISRLSSLSYISHQFLGYNYTERRYNNFWPYLWKFRTYSTENRNFVNLTVFWRLSFRESLLFVWKLAKTNKNYNIGLCLKYFCRVAWGQSVLVRSISVPGLLYWYCQSLPKVLWFWAHHHHHHFIL